MRTIRNILAVAFATMTVAVSMAQFGDPVYVNGYYRRDGTYVRPHYRTRPDGNFWNNWSSYGNINPYTGAVGYRLPSYDYTIRRLPAPSYGSLKYISPLSSYRLPSYDYTIRRLPAPSYGSLKYISPLSSYRLPSLTPSYRLPSLRRSSLLYDW
jgi:hypothetical protein